MKMKTGWSGFDSRPPLRNRLMIEWIRTTKPGAQYESELMTSPPFRVESCW
jgi:hypothetical protein